MKDLPFTVYDFFAYLASGFWLLLITGYAFRMPWYSRVDVSSLMLLAYIVAAYITGHVIAHVSSAVLEQTVTRKWLGRSESAMFIEPSGWRASLFRAFLTPLPEATRSRVRARAASYGAFEHDAGLFFHCHARVKCDAVAFARMNTFLNLYGFARNICMASLVGCAALAVGAVMPAFLAAPPDHSRQVAIIPLLFVALVMFYRYLKFYRLYSVEMYTTYAEGA